MTRHGRRGGAWVLALGVALAGTTGCRGDAVPADGEDESGSSGPGSDPDAGDDTQGQTDDAGDETQGESDTDDPPSPEDAVPPPGGLRRLLAHQYLSSIEYLLGPEAAEAATAPLDPTRGTFDALATLSSVPSAPDIEGYEDSARAVAWATMEHPERLGQWVSCVWVGPYDNGCYEALARDFGRLAWRRPLTDAQVERLVTVATTAREWAGGEFSAGVEYMLMAILQSPYFLYLVEVGDPAPAYRELTGVELATRMSFFLLGRTPSASVLDRAEEGELDSDEGVRALAWELLDQPLARSTVTRFFGELLTTRNLPSKGKSAALFPMFGPALAASMAEETRRLVDEVVFEDDVSALRIFDADYTFIDNQLAALYGYGPVAAGQWMQVPLPEGRAGVLSLSGWLTMSAHNTVNSPTRRGLFVMEQLLCNDVPLPPPRVNPEPVEPAEGQTLRESLQQHMQDPACSGCHALTDPIGFGFEHLDPIGAWQALDNGQPVDASGNLPGVGEFYGADELAALLVDQPELPRCLVDKAYAANLGFIPDAPMAPALDAVGESFAAADHNLKHMLVELIASPVFRLVDEPK
ncbi:MAG: DUF1592 domain-containing protein [Myxococcales bacterium]|nr:DUF1592 domain-containing protein [Myxococcales bacterium]